MRCSRVVEYLSRSGKAWVSLDFKFEGGGGGSKVTQIKSYLLDNKLRQTATKTCAKFILNIFYILITWLVTPNFVRKPLTKNFLLLPIEILTSIIPSQWLSEVSLQQQMEWDKTF